MPPKAAKKRAKVPKDDDPWASLDDHRPRKKPRPSAAPANGLHENNYHEGMPASSQFQSWSDWQAKFNEKERSDKRSFADTFNQKIEAKRDEFDSLLTHASEELDNAASKYVRLMEGSQSEIKRPSQSKSMVQATKSRQEHPLFKAGQTVLQKCHGLMAEYDQANKKSTQSSPGPASPREQWDEDIASVQELLLYGFQHGENIIESLVIPGSGDKEKTHLLTPDKEELSETGRMAVDMYRKSAEGVMMGGPTWGEMAKNQAGVFGRALDGLSGA